MAIRSEEPTHGWFGNYATWSDAAKQSTGYDAEEILSKVKTAVLKVKNGEVCYERDSVVFEKVQYTPQVLKALTTIAAENHAELHVIDFGGSLGSSFFQYRQLLPHTTRLNWIVVEQPHFVQSGQLEIAEQGLSFSESIAKAMHEQRPCVLFLSSVLQYIEHPYELIQRIVSLPFEYIIIDRTAFIEGSRERITLQVVPEWIYKASYPAWFFNEEKFCNAFMGEYDCIEKFDGNIDPREKLDGQWTYRKGYILKKKLGR